MKEHKMISGFAICIVLSALLSLFEPNLNIGNVAISTLYTVSGIMFSIGMSIIVTFNITGVKNKDFKEDLREQIHIIEKKFIVCFIIVSILYLFSNILDKHASIHICSNYSFNYSHLMACVVVYSIIYFIYNFLSIEHLSMEIKDRIDEANEKENKSDN
jgi:hypothetical protein